MRRNLMFPTAPSVMARALLVAGVVCTGVVSVGSGAVSAQTTSTSTSTSTSSPPSQQWSSRIVNSAELSTSTTVPSTSVKVARRKPAIAKSTVTTTSAAPNNAAPNSVAPRVDGASTNNSIPPEIWLALRECESHNRYDLNTGNGYYGAYQFKVGTWQNLGFSGYPHEATPAVQDEAARVLQAKLGWGQWPECSRRIGVR